MTAAVFLALAVACAVSATTAGKRSSAWLLVVAGVVCAGESAAIALGVR